MDGSVLSGAAGFSAPFFVVGDDVHVTRTLEEALGYIEPWDVPGVQLYDATGVELPLLAGDVVRTRRTVGGGRTCLDPEAPPRPDPDGLFARLREYWDDLNDTPGIKGLPDLNAPPTLAELVHALSAFFLG